MNNQEKPTNDTPFPVEQEWQVHIPKPSANEDEYDPSEMGSDFYSPTPSEFKDDMDWMAGNTSDYEDLDFFDILDIFCDIVSWF